MTGNTETVLLLGTDDIARLSSISGNVDIDSLVPFIYIAQKNEIKRILGPNLYNKILADYSADTLTGEYLIIYQDFVVDMLSYFAASTFIKFAPYKITNQGVYRRETADTIAVDFDELNSIITNYNSLGYAIELMFNNYIKDNPVPEYPQECKGDSSFGFPWFL